MGRQAAAAVPRHAASPSTARKRPARRASGRSAAHGTAPANAAAIKRSATAKRAAAARAKPATRAQAAARAQKAARAQAAARARAGTAPRGGAVALPLPLRVARAPFSRALRVRGGGVLDSLLHGRGWIGLVFVLLAGIVFFNVDLLKLNRDIAVTAQKSSAVARENARLRLQLAKLDSSERIQTAAAQRGLLLPAPGDVRYLEADRVLDARRAARLVKAPDAAAAPAPVPQAAAPVAPAPAPVATAAPGPGPQAAPPAQPQAAPQPVPAAGATTAPAG